MRDLIVFALVFGLLPFILLRPYVGVLAWSWIGYMNPHRLTWGAAYEFPFAQVVAVATLIGFTIFVLRGKLPKFAWTSETVLLILLWIFFTLTTFYAIKPELSWPELGHISKVLLMTFLTIILIDDEKKLRYLILLIAFSIGFYGFKGGLYTLATSGHSMVLGPGGSIGDNTAIGLALNMVLPMLYFLAKSEKNVWLQMILKVAFYLSIIAIIGTYSRGALLGLLVVLSLIFLKFRFRYKLLFAVLLTALSPILWHTLPQEWVNRMETIQTYKSDGSAMSRIQAWNTAWNLAVDRPYTGGGFSAINDEEIYDTYEEYTTTGPNGLRVRKSGVHSIYFEVLGENGFITFGIFVALLASSILSARKIEKKFKTKNPDPLFYYASMLEIGIIAYAISGAFLEHASFDLYYHFVALVVVLKFMTKNLPENNPAKGKDRPFSNSPERQVPLAVTDAPDTVALHKPK